MSSPDGRFHVAYNGEIYNYLELRTELKDSAEFRTGTDTEVLLAAYARWGEGCLDRLIGMFAFCIWDEEKQTAFAARDRFGVKPLFYHSRNDSILLSSEIKGLHALGVPRRPDVATWATYFSTGLYDNCESTFWEDVCALPPGSCLTWTQMGGERIRRWYDPAEALRGAGLDLRTDDQVAEELLFLLRDSARLRLRSDVPVGLCLSGGLDSSLLLALVSNEESGREMSTFTFFCEDPRYDETPWVDAMIRGTSHPRFYCRLSAAEVPDLAGRVQSFQDEPFGGLPTLGMAKVHERARAEGVTVLLDGNGLDEGWAGYDYHRRAATVDLGAGPVQGATRLAVREDCVRPEIRKLARRAQEMPVLPDPLQNLQYRDLCVAKLPRAMRFADRVSMMYSRELREPFLDHRLVELGLRQPPERKIRGDTGKWLVRRVAERLLPAVVRDAPKRPVQTPQREWLAGPLAEWATGMIELGLSTWGRDWLDRDQVLETWSRYKSDIPDNSFHIWQWVSLGLMAAS